MTELITGAKGSAHVTSAQQGAINAYTIGTGAYVLDGCAATLTSANTLHISAGHLMVQGRAIEVTATDITIANGTQGTKRHDLACVRYVLSGGVETTTLSVVQGTASTSPVDPTVTGSILAGDATADIPLWRVSFDGITPTVAAIEQTVYPLMPGILYEDVSVDASLSTENGTSVTWTPAHCTASNFLAKQLVRSWPNSTWGNGAIVTVAHDDTWHSATLTTTTAQEYNLVMRFFYKGL